MLLVIAMSVMSGLLFAQESAVERAWKLAGHGRPDEALHLLKQAIQRNPNDPDARLLLGSLLSEEGQQEEAIAQLTEAVRLRPRSAEAQIALGEAYSSFGDLQAARHPFEKAVALQPGSGVAQLDLARVLLESQQFDAAAVHLDLAIKTLEHDSDAATAHYLRAKVYTAHDDARQAVKELREALAIRPAFPEAWSDLGGACQMILDHAGALVALRRAVELAPADSVAQYRLGKEYLAQQQSRLAIAPLQQSDRLNPGDQSTLNALQKALRLDGQLQAADNVTQRPAVVLDRSKTVAQNDLIAVQLNNEGARLQSAGDLPGALEKYRAAVKLFPRSVPIRVNYAVAMLRLGEWSDGLNELHESLLMDPSNVKIRAALRDALAQAPAGAASQWKDRSY